MSAEHATPVEAFGGWSAVIGRLVDGVDLSEAEAEAALSTILSGDASAAQIAGYIVALRVKGETVDELAGMVGAMLEAATPLSLPPDTIDIVGTGGSPQRRIRALNVSTIASIVASAAGATVCKHGNIRASSTSGSFNLLQELGVNFELEPEQISAIVTRHGLGFCFAKAFHPAMRHAGPVRADLGVPTVFNLLGPLSHPGRVNRQVVGVGDPRMVDLVAGALAARGAVHSLVVHGSDSLDELTLTGPTSIREVRDGSVVNASQVQPEDVGLGSVAAEDMPGGSPEENAAIARATLAGGEGPARDIVLLNSAAGLYVAGIAATLAEGVELAAKAIDSGAAATRLEELVQASSPDA